VIEIHTGRYADAPSADERGAELARIELGVQQGLELGLQVNAGHGLNYHNVQAIAAIPGIAELNIATRSWHVRCSADCRNRCAR